jgi:hypothetical protein
MHGHACQLNVRLSILQLFGQVVLMEILEKQNQVLADIRRWQQMTLAS